MVLTVTSSMSYPILCDMSPMTTPTITEVVLSLIDIDHDNPMLRTFILFVQSVHAALKYADAHFYRKAHLSVIKYIVLQSLAANGGTMMPEDI